MGALLVSPFDVVLCKLGADWWLVTTIAGCVVETSSCAFFDCAGAESERVTFIGASGIPPLLALTSEKKKT